MIKTVKDFGDAAKSATQSPRMVGFLRGAGLCALMVAMELVAPGAHAQSGSFTYGLGQDGAPAATDYTGAVTGFNTSTAPILTALLPILALMMAVWQGPRIGKKLITTFIH
jgi:hypothetical protein